MTSAIATRIDGFEQIIQKNTNKFVQLTRDVF